jgi:hypothetical protein
MISRKCWLTYPHRELVEQPILWRMCRAFPEVQFDIRQASVSDHLGIIAVLLSGPDADVVDAIRFLESAGVKVEPIEKSVVEG